MHRREFMSTTALATLATQLSAPSLVGASAPQQSGPWAYMNRNLPDAAHLAVGRMIPSWIAELAFTPSRGWVCVSGNGECEARGIPDECFERLLSYLDAGERINCIAFPPAGGNRWVIIGERWLFARNIDDACYRQLLASRDAGSEIYCVAFPPGGGWVILTSAGFFASGIPSACFDAIEDIRDAGDAPHHVAFTAGGGWIVLGSVRATAAGIPDACWTQVLTYSGASRRITHVAFTPASGWHVSCNDMQALPTIPVGAGLPEVPPAMRTGRVPGVSVAVMQDGVISAQHVYGQPHRGDGRALATTTRFQAASVSKTVAAVGVMTAIRRGVIASLTTDLRADLSATIPNVTGGGAVQPQLTPRALMSHTAGVVMQNAAGAVVGGFGGYPRGLATPTTTQILTGAAPSNSPRARCNPANVGRHVYCGQNQVILQDAIEQATGDDFPTWMLNNVLTPLGMTSSRFVLDPTWTDSRIAVGHDSRGFPIGRRFNMYPEHAAAGLWTTPTDLCRLARVINRNGLLPDGTRLFAEADGNAMRTAVAGSAACGVFVGGAGATLTLEHSGWNAGFRCFLWMRPNAAPGRTGNNALVVMGNMDPGTNAVPWLDTIRAAYISDYSL